MTDLADNFEKLYRSEMIRARELYYKLWDELHPNGKALMQTDLTAEMLRKMSPEARQALAGRYPQDVLKAMTGVQ